jgi:hypothetical protein
MTDLWQCDLRGRNFASTKNRVELVRKIHNGSNSYEYISYQDICTDCELYSKKWNEKRRRNSP